MKSILKKRLPIISAIVFVSIFTVTSGLIKTASASVISQDNFTDTSWNVQDNNVYTPHIMSNGYVLIHQNNAIGVSGTVNGYALYSPNNASAWVNSLIANNRNPANFGIVECDVPHSFSPESGGINCNGNWNFLSFSNQNTITTSPDNNFIIVNLHIPVTLSSSKYYGVSIDDGGSTSGGYGETLLGTNTTANMGNFYFDVGQKNLTSLTPVTALWLQFFGSNFVNPIALPTFYAKIKNTTGGTMNLRDNPGVSSNIIKTLPEDWIVHISTTTDATGNSITEDGYNWYQVTDPTDNVSGWMIGETASSTVQYLTYFASQQNELEASSTDQIATSSRPDLILDAIDHYYDDTSTSSSLYSSDDGSNEISALKNGGYPKELILGIAAMETGGIGFDNEFVQYDYGSGIMQITPPGVFAHEQYNNYAANFGDNRAVAAGITIAKCASDSSNLYQNCYTHGGEYDRTDPKSYQHYSGDINQPEYKYYTNTPQSVYANIKVAMHILADDKFSLYSNINMSTTTGGITYSASDRRNILTTAAYYGIDECGYENDVADRLDNITSYFPTATTSGITDLIYKMHVAGQDNVCVQLHSPGDLSVRDSNGQTVGIINNKIVNDFPLAVNDIIRKSVVILASGDDNYTYKVVGTKSGTYGLDITIKNGNKKTTFKATNIPILPNEIHTYSLDQKLLSKGQNGVTLMVDRNADGIVDRTVKTGLTLDGVDYNKGATIEEIQASLSGDIDPPVRLQTEIENKSEGASYSKTQNNIMPTLKFTNDTQSSSVNKDHPYLINNSNNE